MKKAFALLLAILTVSAIVISAIPASAEYVPTSFNTVPKEYVRVDYLESDGYEIINSGIYPKANTKIEVEFELVDNTVRIGGGSAAGIVGSNYNAKGGGPCIQISYKQADQCYTCRVGANVMDNTTVAKDTGVKHVVTVDATEGYINFDGTVIKSSDSGSGYVEQENRPTFGIFGVRMKTDDAILSSEGTNVVANGSERIYYVKFWEGETLVGEFIPVYRAADKVGGMYDLVTEKFFGNDYNAGYSDAPIYMDFKYPGYVAPETTAPVTTEAPETTKKPVLTKKPETTAAPTATQEPAATQAPATEKPAEKSGCGSAASVGIAVIVSALGTALLRKKED